MIAGFILFAVLSAILWVGSNLIPKGIDNEIDLVKTITNIAGKAFVVIALIFVAADSVRFVEAGHAGVVTRFGAVTGRSIDPGLQVKLPFIERIHLYDTRVQKVTFEDLSSATEEYQDVKVTGVINYRLNAESVPWLFQNVGSAEVLEEKVLVPALAQSLKSILPTYAILDVLPNRQEIAQRVANEMTQTFVDYQTESGLPVIFFAPNEDAVSLDERRVVHLQNIEFSSAFNQAIEERQVELQKIEKERNILEQRKIQAKQAIAVAEGEAEANTILAASLAERGNFVLQFKAIEKLTDKIKIILLPTDSGIIPVLGETLLSGD